MSIPTSTKGRLYDLQTAQDLLGRGQVGKHHQSFTRVSREPACSFQTIEAFGGGVSDKTLFSRRPRRGTDRRGQSVSQECQRAPGAPRGSEAKPKRTPTWR